MIRALADAEPWTRVVLAEALIGLDRVDTAVHVLREALAHENPMVRLQAMETIVDTGLLATELQPAIAALVPDDPGARPYDGRLARHVLQLYEDEAAQRGGSE
jgi:hypothetical protein